MAKTLHLVWADLPAELRALADWLVESRDELEGLGFRPPCVAPALACDQAADMIEDFVATEPESWVSEDGRGVLVSTRRRKITVDDLTAGRG